MKRIISLFKTSTIKDTLISFIGLSFTAGFGFLFTIIMARNLGPENYGVFSAVLALASIAYNLGDFGISSALINFIPKLKEKRSVLINTSFWVQMFVAVLCFVVFIIFSFYNNKIVPNSIPAYLVLAGTLSFNYLLIGYAQGIFTAERRFWIFSLSQVIDSSLKIVLIFFLLSLTKLSVSTALAANVISTFFALMLTFSKDLYFIKPEFDNHFFRKMANFSKWIAFSRVFSVLFSKIDIILLNLLASSHDAGIFAAASRVTLLFSLLVSSLNSVINPRFSSFDTKKKVVTYIKKLSLFIGGIALIMLVCAAFAEQIIWIVFGNSYLEAIPVFQLMTIVMIPFLLSLVTTPAILYTYNKPDFFAKTTAAQVVLIIVIEILLIPRFTYQAPIIAIGTTNVIIFIITTLKLKQLINEDRR